MIESSVEAIRVAVEFSRRNCRMIEKLIPTALVGNYPQPDWLVDKKILPASGPPRVRMSEVWRLPEELLEEAQSE